MANVIGRHSLNGVVILEVDGDPSDGTVAPQGSISLDPANGKLWIKSGAPSTAWTEAGTGTGGGADFSDNYLYISDAYTSDTPRRGGLIVNMDPTTTATTVNGVYVAGVAATSNPTVVTTGSGTFAQYDFIQISGSTDNDGLYEVHSHSGTTLTVKGVGTTATIEDFPNDQFVAGASDGATITKVGVSLIRTDTDGQWEIATGNATSATGLQFRGIWPKTVSTLAYAASVNLDLDPFLPPVRSLTLTGIVTFTTSNRAAARSIQLRIVGDTVQRSLTFPAGWKFLGGPTPTVMPANQTALLSVVSYGTADTDIIAGFSFDTSETGLRGAGAADQVAVFSDVDSLGSTAGLTYDGTTFSVVGDTVLTGNLNVTGTSITATSETVLIADNHLYLNNGYTADPAQTGGLVVNIDPDATATEAVAAGGFVAGVAATSNPTIEVASTTGFATADFIQVSGSTSNDGLYEVLALLTTPTRIQVRGVGVTGTVEDFTQNQFVTEAGVGQVDKVKIAIMRAGIDGIWETGTAAATPVSFVDLGTGSGNVTKVGTPVDDQIGIWTGDGTIEGHVGLTWTGTAFAADGAATFNNTGAAVNFRVAGSGEANLLVANGTSAKVGIGVLAPSYLLHVQKSSNSGVEGTYPGIRVVNTNASAHSFSELTAEAANGVVLKNIADGLGTGSPTGEISGANGTKSNHPFILYTNNTKRMRFDATSVIISGTGNHLVVPEITTPATPANGSGTFYPKSDGLFYFLNDGTHGAVEHLVTKEVVTTLSYAASVNIDMHPGLPPNKTVTLTGVMTLTTSNRAAGRSVMLRIVGDTVPRALTLPAGWTFLGGPAPTAMPANAVAILSITAYGTADTDIVAGFAFETSETGLGGAGAANQIAYFTDADSLAGNAALTWTGSAFAADGSATFNASLADADFNVGATGVTNALHVQGSDGFVGFGVVPTDHHVHIEGSGPQLWVNRTGAQNAANFAGLNATPASGSANVYVRSLETHAADVGGTIGLMANTVGTGSPVPMAYIWGKKENATSANENGYLAFGTRLNGSGAVERMRITSAGAVQIPTDSANLSIGAGGDLTLQHNGTDSIIANATGRLQINGFATSEVVVNESGVDVDFRVEGFGDPNTLVVDAGLVATTGAAGAVGIGVAPGSVAHKLHVVGGALASTKNALYVSGTLNGAAAGQTGSSLLFTTVASGGASAGQIGLLLNLDGAYGVAGDTATTWAAQVSNTSASLGVSSWSGAASQGSIGAQATSSGGSAGHRTGVYGVALNSSTLNAGVRGLAQQVNAGANFGVIGQAHNQTGTKHGGFFYVHGDSFLTPTFATSAALMADNTDAPVDIFVARNNGTPVFTVANGGLVTLTNGLTIPGTPTNPLTINTRAYSFPASFGAAGAVLTDAAGTGVLTWAAGAGGGDSISVNGVAAADADFDDTTPAAVGAGVNVLWQKDAGTPNNISAYVAANAVTNSVLAQMAANTVKVNNTGAGANATDLTIGANTVLGRAGSNIVAATLVTNQITAAAVTNAKLANMAQFTLKGRIAAGSGVPTDLTGTEVTAFLDVFTPTLKGLAPAATGGGTTNFLRADGTWAAPAGAGNVTKVGTPVNNQVGVWTGDGTLEGTSSLVFDGTSLTVGTKNVFPDAVSTLAYAASVNLDMDPALVSAKSVTLTGVMTLTTSNRAAGRQVVLRIVGDVSDRALTFPAGWKFLGGPAPVSMPANKTALLSIVAYGTLDTDIVAAFTFDTTEVAMRGAGTVNQVAYFSDADSLTSNAGLTYDGADLTTTGIMRIANGGTELLPALHFGATSDPNTGIWHPGADILAISAGGNEMMRWSTAGTVINEGSDSSDFRVESNTNTGMLFVNGGENRVQIGRSTDFTEAQSFLSVDGAVALKEITIPAGNPDANYGYLYPKAGGLLYWMDDLGTEYNLTANSVENIAGHIETAANKTYYVVSYSGYSGTITDVITECDSGTCTATVKINGVSLGGTANSVSSTEQLQAHVTSNTIAVGDTITFVITSNSSALEVRFTILVSR